jgi:hypothetical protein
MEGLNLQFPKCGSRDRYYSLSLNPLGSRHCLAFFVIASDPAMAGERGNLIDFQILWDRFGRSPLSQSLCDTVFPAKGETSRMITGYRHGPVKRGLPVNPFLRKMGQETG